MNVLLAIKNFKREPLTVPVVPHGLKALRIDPVTHPLKPNPGPQQLLLLRGLHPDGPGFFFKPSLSVPIPALPPQPGTGPGVIEVIL